MSEIKYGRGRARRPGRGVVIPDIPELDERARSIRARSRQCGRVTLETAIENGKELKRCRELLKVKRKWLAWVQREFECSHTHCDRLIAISEAPDELHNLCNLGVCVSAIALLAKAPEPVLKRLRQRAEAGQRVLVKHVRDELRAERAPVILTSPVEYRDSELRRYFSRSDESARGRTVRPYTAEDLEIQDAEEFARGLSAFHRDRIHNSSPESLAKGLLSEEGRATALKQGKDVAEFLEAYCRALEGERAPKKRAPLKIVSDNGEPTKH